MFDSIITRPMSFLQFLICLITALALGIFSARILSFRRHQTKTMALCLALMPSIVTVVIMLVNGNIGAGLAVAGSFALVRFRSAPGSARDVMEIFFTVALGLACGMGHVALAAVFFVLFSIAVIALTLLHFGEGSGERTLKIIIPEDLDYEGLFSDLFEQYTTRAELMRVKTTNMGTLFELSYSISFKDNCSSKRFIDDLRCRNGNLNIMLSREFENEAL